MSRKIKWGILGCARIAKDYVIPAILKASNSEFYAIASRDGVKAREFMEEFNCRKAYASYEELLNDPDIDAIYLPLPHSIHKEWTIKAAEKGKHILCEKPLGLNVQECRDMIDVCAKNKVLLMEAFMYRYSKRIKKVLELLKEGVIGDIKLINSSFGFMMENPESDFRMCSEFGGGSLYDVGCYPINFLGMVLGKQPVSMSVECEMKNEVDNALAAVLKYDNGVIGIISCWFNAHIESHIQIVGTKGIMDVSNAFFENYGMVSVIMGNERREFKIEECERYVQEVEDFANSIINNRQPSLGTEETLRNIEIINKLQGMMRLV